MGPASRRPSFLVQYFRPNKAGQQAPMWDRWKHWARTIKRDAHALYLAARDPRVPWYAKALAIAVAGYALSPIDLIPDFVPVLGLLDDIVIVPLGVALAIRLTPKPLWEQMLREAEAAPLKLPKLWWGVALIVLVWALLFSAFVWGLWRLLASA
jgi:uncharacterized membrane protein YkvA (DUF1232 family)